MKKRVVSFLVAFCMIFSNCAVLAEEIAELPESYSAEEVVMETAEEVPEIELFEEAEPVVEEIPAAVEETVVEEAPVEEAPVEEEAPAEEAEPVEEEDAAEETETADEAVIFVIENDVLVAYNGTDAVVTVPDGVKTIGKKAFFGNETVEKVVLPDSVKTIGVSAFEGCVKLEKIEAEELEAVEAWAFVGCEALEIEFDEDVVVDEQAFERIETEEVTGEEPTEETPAEEEAPAEEELPEEDETVVIEGSTEEPAEEVIEEEIPAEEVEDTSWMEIADLAAVAEGNSAVISWTGSAELYRVVENVGGVVMVRGITAETAAVVPAADGEHSYAVIAVKGEAIGEASEFVTVVIGAVEEPVADETVEAVEEPEEVEIAEDELEDRASVTIVTQPVNFAGALGTQATFTVSAVGVGSYTWQYTSDGKNWWDLTWWTGYNMPSMSFEIQQARTNYQYRCKLTGTDSSVVYTNVVRVSTAAPISITKQPTNAFAADGGKATFSVEATNVSSYAWEYSSDGGVNWWKLNWWEGYNTASITFDVNKARCGYLYRCSLTDGSGKITTTQVVTVSIAADAVITMQPQDASAVEGGTVVFSVVAQGAASYAWQYSSDGGANWWTLSWWPGYDNAMMSFTANADRAKYIYRCAVTGVNGKVIYSDTVKVTIGADAQIIIQPSNVITPAGSKCTFALAATNAASYAWQYSSDGGKNWWNLSWWAGYDTASITFDVTADRMKYQYRCAVTGTNGKVAYSDVVTVSAPVQPVQITKQPVNVTVADGGEATFSVEATNAASYAWQYSSDGGVNWWNLSWWAGYNTPSITFTASKDRAKYLYRCAVSDANGTPTYTSIVTVTLGGNPEITVQPVDATADATGYVTLTVAGNNIASYAWQYSSDGGANWWTLNWWSGYNAPSMTFEANDARCKYLYRCELTGTNGQKITTDTVHVYGNKPVVITTQPVSAAAANYEQVTFSVVAQNVESYAWQYSSDGGTNWYTLTWWSGYDTADLTFEVSGARRPYKYRCALTSESGAVTYTNVVEILDAAIVTIDEIEYSVDYVAWTATIHKCHSTASSITIPNQVNGINVTEVEPSAFENVTTLVSITLPQTITKIGTRAFAGCTSLSTMN